MKFLNSYSIDSCKIRIKVNHISILDNRLTENYISVNEKSLKENGELEIDETYFKAKAVAINDNGIKTKFLLQNLIMQDKKQESFLIILLNAKTLKKDYLNGITKNNIKEVYDYLISLKIVHFSFDVFLYQSHLSDLDIKVDFINKDFDTFFSTIKNECDLTKLSSQSLKGYRLFNKTDNKGIEFGDRVRATERVPFFKIYAKKLQLMSAEILQNDLFSKTYLKKYDSINDFKHVLRAEYTLKNKSAINIYLNCGNTLNEVLSTKQSTFINAIQKIKQIHISERKKAHTINELTPNDQLILNLIQEIHNLTDKICSINKSTISNGLHFTILNSIALNGLQGVQKSRTKKKLEYIYFNHFLQGNKEEIIQLENDLKNGLKMIGFIL